MSRWGLVAAIAVSLWIGGALQQSVSYRLAIFGAVPDFLLVIQTALCLLTSRAGGATIGFSCGVIQGALAGANLTHYAISRAVAGFLLSWSRSIGLESTLLSVFLSGAAVTLVAQTTLMILAPPSTIAAFLGATIRSALYNGVLAIPAYLMLRRVLGPSHL